MSCAFDTTGDDKIRWNLQTVLKLVELHYGIVLLEALSITVRVKKEMVESFITSIGTLQGG